MCQNLMILTRLGDLRTRPDLDAFLRCSSAAPAVSLPVEHRKRAIQAAGVGLEYYHLFADVWLVGILPVALYPFFGGKVWRRYRYIRPP
jgi:hypothetical protein